MQVSVIIPTINRYNYLYMSIISLINNCEERIGEVIIVDQTPINKINQYILNQIELLPINIKIVKLEKPGQSTARNKGIAMAENELIFLWEDDTIATDDIIKEHVDVIKKYKNAVTTGLSHAPFKNREMLDQNYTIEKYTDVFATGNALITKSAWEKIGGFDLIFNQGMGADSDFGTRLYLSGYEVVQCPRAIQIHFKANTGGLRTHNANWLHSYTFLKQFPPVTTVYQLHKYYSFLRIYFISFIYLRASVRERGLFMNIPLLISNLLSFFLSCRSVRRIERNNLDG